MSLRLSAGYALVVGTGIVLAILLPIFQINQLV